MKKIFGLIEKNDDVVNDFWRQYDADLEIHVYSPIIESCEDSLFYCFSNMVSLFWEEDDIGWIVTDVEEVYQLANKLCASLFQKIIYIDHNVDAKFSKSLDVNELLLYDYKMIQDINAQLLLREFVSKISIFDMEFYCKFENDIKYFVKQSDKKSTTFLAHICRLLLYMEKEGNIRIHVLYRLLLLSMLMKLEYLPEHTNAYLTALLKNPDFNEANYYFIWNQFKGLVFKNLLAVDETTSEFLDCLYKESYKRYMERAKTVLEKIPSQKRHPDRVLILTIQFIGKNHAPTKTVLERCRTYTEMGKEVYLINTTEQYTSQGYIPLFNAQMGTVAPGDDLAEILSMDGERKIWYRQLDNDISIWDRFLLLVEYIKQIKPKYILSIGTGSMLADLSGNMVPCASMSLVFSTLPKTENCIKILGRNLSQNELGNVEMGGIIESCFTFELKPQKTKFTRRQYQIPEDKFVLVIVGIRLDFEINSKFCNMLEKVCKNGCFVVFAGVYDTYHKIEESNPLLAQNSTFIGYCNDMLALMEICDLYVNPKRFGGGFSVIEAYTKGVPGVYLKTGDVYTAGGEDFSVNDFDEMEQTILRYKGDRNFYKMMSDRAKKRAKLMTSSLKAMKELDRKIVEKVEKEFW